jgi:UDP-sugar transporter A1/2/3
MQLVSLFLLLLSALVMEGIIRVDHLLVVGVVDRLLGIRTETFVADNATDGFDAADDGEHRWGARHFTHGVAPILLASFISGLAGALSQKNLQAVGGGRNAYLFSMELCAATSLILGASLLVTPDGEAIAKRGFWDGWTVNTLIPIFTNSVGGITVGLVTKHAGSVRKGFALIFGIFLSGIIQALVQPDEAISTQQLVGGVMAAFSLYMHATNPPGATKSLEQEAISSMPYQFHIKRD